MAATTTAAAPTAADGELLLGLYRRMRLIRRFEEAVQELFLKGEVHGTTHLYNGEEASATGVGSALVPGDRVAGTYRGHGHALAIGTRRRACSTSCSGARPASAAAARAR